MNKYAEELEYHSTTPWYIGRDGMPNIWLLAGVFIGWGVPVIAIIIYRNKRKKWLAQRLQELK